MCGGSVGYEGAVSYAFRPKNTRFIVLVGVPL